MMQIAWASTAFLISIQVPVLEAASKCVCQGQRAYPVFDDPRSLVPIRRSYKCSSSASREESGIHEALSRQLRPALNEADC